MALTKITSGVISSEFQTSSSIDGTTSPQTIDWNSSQIFRILKSEGLSYAYIFYITAALYACGVFLYYLLIIDYQTREVVN